MYTFFILDIKLICFAMQAVSIISGGTHSTTASKSSRNATKARTLNPITYSTIRTSMQKILFAKYKSQSG